MENLLVWIIVGAAGLWAVLRMLRKRNSGNSGSCGSGCGRCGDASKPNPLVKLRR